MGATCVESCGEKVLELVSSKLGATIKEPRLNLGDAEIKVLREGMLDIFRILKIDSELSFNSLLDVTVVDWLDERECRFEVVYHLLSIYKLYRLRVKVLVPENCAEVDSVCGLWSSAKFIEREAWDMYGIVFKGHPDLRRILMYEEFEGHPLRKDYPVQGKQPRVKMRHVEVRNTAVDMKRNALVQINSRN